MNVRFIRLWEGRLDNKRYVGVQAYIACIVDLTLHPSWWACPPVHGAGHHGVVTRTPVRFLGWDPVHYWE